MISYRYLSEVSPVASEFVLHATLLVSIELCNQSSKKNSYLVWNTFPHFIPCISGDFEPSLTGSPITLLFTFRGGSLVSHAGILLLGRCHAGNFRYRCLLSGCVFFLLLWNLWISMVLEDLFDGDALEFRLSLCFFVFNLFVLGEVF
jgi:hypothetical protein